MKLPELLLPAGDKEKAYVAFRYGADAIYMGMPMFSLRTRMNTVTESDIEEIVNFAREHNKKVYIVINGFPHQNMMEILTKHMKRLEEIKPHGLIIADPGVLSLANEYAPSLEKHLSVQSSTVNVPAMKFWQNNNICRVILAREIAIEEVVKIHNALPGMELEYFVHGAVCMAYSGRCILSNFMSARDSNRGACSHTCRWNYRVFDDGGNEIDVSDRVDKRADAALEPKGKSCCDTKPVDKPCCGSGGKAKSIHDFESKKYLEEELRPNEFIPVEEDFHGTHMMSSRDMCMIEHLQKVIDAGVISLKVEGRNKTIYYLATVTRAYRQALDNIADGKPFDEKLWEEIHATANRGFFAGFLHGKPQIGDQQYESGGSESTHHFVGKVLSAKDGKITFDVRNRLNIGDEIEFIFPDMKDDIKVTITKMEKGGSEVTALHGGNGEGSIFSDIEIPEGILMRKKMTEERTETYG
ncbi:U32 family peptidase [Candidatus Peregrinibacteria bacterium]|nr:MAG: U32 family peptidase [Candidatus Peregrinibacteria bacterium]